MPTLSHRTATNDTTVTQDSNQWHDCHAGQQPMTWLLCRTTTTTRFSPKAARNRWCQGFANIGSSGLLPRKHSPDGATWAQSTHLIKQAFYSFIDLGRMKGWVGLVGWPVANGLPTQWSPVGCRPSAGQGQFTGQRPAFRQLCYATNR